MGNQLFLLVCLIEECLGHGKSPLDQLFGYSVILDVEKTSVLRRSADLRRNGFPGLESIVDGAEIDDWDFIFCG